MLLTSTTPISSPLLSALHVDREDITFANLSPAVVRVRVRVHHRGTLPTPATELVLRAAPFGAFVPSLPVATLRVPALVPGQSTKVTTTLTAPIERRRPRSAQLPPDPLRLLDWARFAWAGNFDILIGNGKAERHCAQAVRLTPGATNVALFIVGHGKDEYRFAFLGEGRSWNPRVGYQGGLMRHLALLRRGFQSPLRGHFEEFQPDQWIPGSRCSLATLLVDPPAGVTQGMLAVQVDQRSTGRQALVEFGFGVATIPPGCFRS